MNKIYFYSWKKEFFELSNFSEHRMVIDGKSYPTVEHYFQAMKFKDQNYQERIRLAKTPAYAKKLGSSRSHEIHSDWDIRRIEVMKKAIKAKFTQHDDLLRTLIGTDSSILIEDSPYDSFWGCGRDKKGKNMLGQLLMELRKELQDGFSKFIEESIDKHNK